MFVNMVPGAVFTTLHFLQNNSLECWSLASLRSIVKSNLSLLGPLVSYKGNAEPYFRYETAGLVAVTRSMDIAVAYVIQVSSSAIDVSVFIVVNTDGVKNKLPIILTMFLSHSAHRLCCHPC